MRPIPEEVLSGEWSVVSRLFVSDHRPPTTDHNEDR